VIAWLVPACCAANWLQLCSLVSEIFTSFYCFYCQYHASFYIDLVAVQLNIELTAESAVVTM